MVGKQVIYPPNLFNTWLNYRKHEFGDSRADVIRELNIKLNRKYANNIAYDWVQQNQTVSENIILEVIYPELADLLKWYFNKNQYNSDNVDFKKLALDLRPPIKIPK